MNNNQLSQRLTKRLVSDAYSLKFNNTDLIRFPKARRSFIASIKECLVSICDYTLNLAGYIRVNDFQKQEIDKKTNEILNCFSGISDLFDSLGNESSKEILVEVLAFRILGNRFTRFGKNDAELNPQRKAGIINSLQKKRIEKLNYLDGYLDLFEIGNDLNKKINIIAHKINILNTFILEQYKYNGISGLPIKAEVGDVVVDGGGCWGDTALYFASKVGDSGEVHVFEFLSRNLEILRRNLNLNPSLKRIINVHEKALWDKPDCQLNFSGDGPSTTLINSFDFTENNTTTKTESIDNWFRSSGLKTVDYIKLDIEGAEARAIIGAQDVISMFKPKMAIALYHSVADFEEIPRLIKKVNPHYRLFLDHFTIHEEETILFACL